MLCGCCLMNAVSAAALSQPVGIQNSSGDPVIQKQTAVSSDSGSQIRLASAANADGIEIYSSDGYIYVRSPKRVEAKVFSILGQLVANPYVGPGLTEIQIQARGIYIVKVGTVTQKVAL